MRYYPNGSIRTQEGTALPTDKLYTDQQRETANDIYYYGARFYNADIGRSLSADSIVPGAGNPQELNRWRELNRTMSNDLPWNSLTTPGNSPIIALAW